MSLVKEMGCAYAVHEYGTNKSRSCRDPNILPLTIALKFVFRLSICDMHFDVCVVQPVDGCKVAEGVAEGLAEDVLCAKLKS